MESPIRSFTRVTTGPTTVGDVEIPGDARVMILCASANRDERHFDQADKFNVTRSNDSIEVDGTAERAINNLINGWATVPVSVTPGS